MIVSVATSELLVSNVGLLPKKPVETTDNRTYAASLHASIHIESNSDFTTVGAAYGCSCVRGGAGIERDPYIISRWVLNASIDTGIYISDTNAYSVITGLVIYGNSYHVGIVLNNVGNVTVENSIIKDNFAGVYAVDARNLTFANNTIENNEYGIRLEASDSNLVSANYFMQDKLAIFLRGSDNTVTDNRVTTSGFGAINIDGTLGRANGNVIEANSVTNSSGYAIGMWEATNCLVKSNNITRNGAGITLTDNSQNNTIDWNTVTNSEGNGIAISEHSVRNVVSRNTVLGNGDGVNTFDLLDLTLNNTWQNNTYATKNPNALD